MRKLKINTREILWFWRERLSLLSPNITFSMFSLFDISIIASLLKFDATTQFTKSVCVFFFIVFLAKPFVIAIGILNFRLRCHLKRVWSCGVNDRGF